MPGQLAAVFLVCLLTMVGCNKNQNEAPQVTDSKPKMTAPREEPTTPAAPLKATPLLNEPLETSIVETTNEALPIWRKYAKSRPLLVIISQGPALVPIPEEALDEAAELLHDGDDTALKTRTGMTDPDPVFLPPMSVSAALDANWLSGVVWVFPSSSSPDKIDPEVFRQQLVEAGFASATEVQALTFNAGVFRGSVRGKSFTAAPLAALPPLEQAALLHVDIDYFKPLYKGEIKTPLHGLLFEVLKGMQDKGWRIASATVSLSNIGVELPLQTRFLGQELADVLLDPSLLAGDLPQEWQERANALYLENFMQKDEQKKIYEGLEKKEPADPSLKFALYHLARQSNNGDAALNYLQQAVRIDPVYALEYLSLADLALQKGKPEKAVEMVLLARAARPQDPFVLMKAVRTMLNAGATEQGKTLLPDLDRLQWSTIYYPELAQEAEGLATLLRN